MIFDALTYSVIAVVLVLMIAVVRLTRSDSES
jgi:hypothetical protein